MSESSSSESGASPAQASAPRSARRTLSRVFRRSRPDAPPSQSGPTPGGEPREEGAPWVAELRSQLAEERTGILGPLTSRMSEYGMALLEGRNPPGERIQEIVALWQEYESGLHAPHLVQLTQALPYLNAAANCQDSGSLLVGETERSDRRVREVRSFLSGYLEDPTLYHQLLGISLKDAETVELSWNALESVLASSCLPSGLPARVLDSWKESLPQTRRKGEELRTRVHHLPAGPAPSAGPSLVAPPS